MASDATDFATAPLRAAETCKWCPANAVALVAEKPACGDCGAEELAQAFSDAKRAWLSLYDRELYGIAS